MPMEGGGGEVFESLKNVSWGFSINCCCIEKSSEMFVLFVWCRGMKVKEALIHFPRCWLRPNWAWTEMPTRRKRRKRWQWWKRVQVRSHNYSSCFSMRRLSPSCWSLVFLEESAPVRQKAWCTLTSTQQRRNMQQQIERMENSQLGSGWETVCKHFNNLLIKTL